jgi:hypothetical protein
MNSSSTTAESSTNGQSTAHDLFALSDEQILEIEPEAQDAEVGEEERAANGSANARADSSTPSPSHFGASARNANVVEADRGLAIANRPAENTSHQSPATGHAAAEPPKWLAERMADPQSGGEARELWNGMQQTRQEAAAYREVFAKPEEARAAAERARLLDDIDRAYFAGDTQQRSQLAAMMLREDPAAFREMVFAGLRALEDAGKSGAGKSVAQVFRPEGVSSMEASTTADRRSLAPEGASYSAAAASSAPTAVDASGQRDSQLAAYAAFERAANQELEQSVGGAIERTLDQALPNANRTDGAAMKGRLAATIRQDIEKALQDDSQLGQQVAQILAARRLNDESRAQVVRLIGDRARQLVPGAAKRVLQDWTQTTLAAHRSHTSQNEAAGRSDLVPANGDTRSSRTQAGDTSRPAARNDNRGSQDKKIDYRKLSDAEILNL